MGAAGMWSFRTVMAALPGGGGAGACGVAEVWHVVEACWDAHDEMVGLVLLGVVGSLRTSFECGERVIQALNRCDVAAAQRGCRTHFAPAPYASNGTVCLVAVVELIKCSHHVLSMRLSMFSRVGVPATARMRSATARTCMPMPESSTRCQLLPPHCAVSPVAHGSGMPHRLLRLL